MRSDKIYMRHITEEALEQYVLRHLSAHEADAIEQHISVCERCRQQLTLTDDFIRDIRNNLGRTSDPNLAVRNRVVVLPVRWHTPK